MLGSLLFIRSQLRKRIRDEHGQQLGSLGCAGIFADQVGTCPLHGMAIG